MRGNQIHEQVHKLLHKTSHYDSDERFMALSDLTAELEKLENIEVLLQPPIRNAILKRFEDQSRDVQSIAVKCLSTVVQKFEMEEVIEFVKKLGPICFVGDENLRDVYTLGLKTIIASVPDTYGSSISNELVKVVYDLKSSLLDDKQNATCMEIFKDVIRRFGSEIPEQHEKLLSFLVPFLQNDNESLRKKAVGVTGLFVKHLNDANFHLLMDCVVSHIKQGTDEASLYSYIQTIGMISRSAGPRIASYLGQIVPLLTKFCHRVEENPSGDNLSHLELIDNCLQAFESLILRCPSEISPHIDSLLRIALYFISYDPLYTYEDNTSLSVPLDPKDDDEGDWGSDEDNENDMFEDESDVSWKVRLSAAKVIDGFITAKDDILRAYYDMICTALLDRFKERNNNVKLEIFHAFVTLLRAALVRSDSKVQILSPRHVRNRSSFDLLEGHIKRIVQESLIVLSKSSVEVSLGILSVFHELIFVRQGGLHEYLPELFREIMIVAQNNNNSLKKEALSVIALSFQFHPPIITRPLILDIIPTISAAIKENYVKTKVQALEICSLISKSVRSFEEVIAPEFFSIIEEVYLLIQSQLCLPLIESEVKDAALIAAAQLMAYCGDHLSDYLVSTVQTIHERIKNEVTRRVAITAITTIAKSQLRLDLSFIAEPLVEEMTLYLKKHSFSLKHAAAESLIAVIQNSNTKLPPRTFNFVVKEAVQCISFDDLHLTCLLLNLLDVIINLRLPEADFGTSIDLIFQCILKLIESPLLQDDSLNALKTLCSSILSLGYSKYEFSSILNSLLNCAYSGNTKSSIYSVAEVISALANSTDARQSTVEKFSLDLTNARSSLQKEVALICLGNIGRSSDMSKFSNLMTGVVSMLSDSNADVQWAASYAFGSITIGNSRLPQLLMMFDSSADSYLLFNSLKLVLGYDKVENLVPHINNINSILFENMDNKDEGVRSMVSECLGRLLSHDPETMISQLELKAASPCFLLRATVASSLKYVTFDQSKLALWKSKLPHFIKLMHDPDLLVQRSAFQMLHSIAHTNLELISSLLVSTILPIIYNATKPNPSLVRSVDYGPFKHQVDDGLPLRQAAFTCMDTLMEHAANRLIFSDFAESLKEGFNDVNDIQQLCYGILHKFANIAPKELLEVLDLFPDNIMKNIKLLIKQMKGQDPESARATIRAAIRAIEKIRRIPGAEQVAKFEHLYARVLSTPVLANIIKEVGSEGAVSIHS